MSKVLLIVSPTTSFIHKSGEVEVKLLQLGFKLNGYRCDILGIDSDDFDTYDIYIVFSLQNDLDPFVAAIETNKYLLVYPQTESYSQETADRVSIFLARSKNSYVITRNTEEKKFYSSQFGLKRIYSVPGWFLEPFIWTRTNNVIHLKNTRYGLSFVGPFNRATFDSIFEECKKSDHHLIVISTDVKSPTTPENGFLILPRLTYGSDIWYSLLQNCSFFFEPNNRLTNSALEATFLQKPIISIHHLALNAYIGFEAFFSNLASFHRKERELKHSPPQLFPFRTEKITYDIIKHYRETHAHN